MANNLIISYDLISPGQNYEKVAEKIKSLGMWAKVHKSVWYVKSTYSASDASSIVWAVMDKNDTLFVVDSTNNQASWYNLSEEVSKFIKEKWNT